MPANRLVSCEFHYMIVCMHKNETETDWLKVIKHTVNARDESKLIKKNHKKMIEWLINVRKNM